MKINKTLNKFIYENKQNTHVHRKGRTSPHNWSGIRLELDYCLEY